MEHATRNEALRETAASWYDRLDRDKVSDETKTAFALWLAESPEHLAAFQELDRTWYTLKSVAHAPQILALRHETALRLTRRTSSRIRPLMWATAVVAIILGLSLVGWSTILTGDPGSFRKLLDVFHTHGDGPYSTRTGERLTVTLKDGSQLTLDTQTELEVAFTQAERVVHIARGQALFEVAKDHGRPFVVTAYNRRFVAVGTAFDVRLDGAQINVTMIEGTVRVERATDARATADPTPVATPAATRSTGSNQKASIAHTESDPPANPTPVVTILTAGEQLTVDNESEDHVRPADPERVISWSRGRVIFENTRLADAVAEINRYSDTKIKLTDPALADLRLSGGFSTGRPTVFVEAITTYYPIQIAKADDHAIILTARQ